MSSTPELLAAQPQPDCAAGTPTEPGNRRAWLATAGLFLLVAALYLPSMANGFVFDDHLLILQQRRPESAGELLQVFTERHWPDLPYYRPVARLTMVAQKMLHGDNPAPYHAFNAGVMGLVAAAAFLLLRTRVFHLPLALAWVGALLVGVHPIASSCVYPICSGRETSLPALFILLCTSAWLRAGAVWRGVALLTFAAALLSKEQAIVLPVILLIADVLRLSPRDTGNEPLWWFRRYTPLVVMVLFYLGTRQVLFGAGEEHKLAVTEQPILPLLTVMYATQTTFLPFVPLTYEPTPLVWFSWWRQGASWLIVAALAVALARVWPRMRSSVLFWLAWIVLVNLPTANILNQEACFDERYELLSLVGVVALIGTVLAQGWQHRAVRVVSFSTATVLILLAAGISYGRAAYFRDDFTFFAQWKATDPEFDFAGLHLQAARLEMRRDKYASAEAHARAALEAAPGSIPARLTLGDALLGEGRIDEAQREFEAVLAEHWEYPEGLAGIARVHAARGEWSAAATRYRAALRQQPIHAETAREFAWLLATCPEASVRDGQAAVRWATIVVEADRQQDPQALDTLAAAHAEGGDFAAAIAWAERAVAARRNDEDGPLRRRLDLYRAQRPYRQETASPGT
ncbi:MAG: tetratricopeptide repeat protein [Pirellulales bacterium]|nr:tetratricopeptide repeat protein [Pirellulales bacterium]